MKNLKKPLSFEEQLSRLEAHGMTINCHDNALSVLKRINYYRFTGYAIPFRIDQNNSDYKPGTTFEAVHRIYKFDEAMRNVLKDYIEIAEVYYRTQISYGFCMAKCLQEPHDQHYDENNYYYKQGYREIRDAFLHERDRYKDSLIVKHHDVHYGGKLPLWVIVDLLSFSSLSKLYGAMYESEQESIAAAVGTGCKTLRNHLHCLSVLRNKCAHAARLYDNHYYPRARFGRRFLKKTGIDTDSLFAYIVVLYRRLPDSGTKNSLVHDLERVMNDYQHDIIPSVIGFPDNWKSVLLNS